jgi:hypothetical protein
MDPYVESFLTLLQTNAVAKRIPSQVEDFYSQAPLTHQETMREMRERLLVIIPEGEECHRAIS